MALACDGSRDAAKAGQQQEGAREQGGGQVQGVAHVVEAVRKQAPLLSVGVQVGALRQGRQGQAS